MNLLPISYLRARSLKMLEGFTHGSLTLTTPEGVVKTYTGKDAGPKATLKIHDWEMVRHLLWRGDIAFGEDYINGLWETEDLEALIMLFLVNFDQLEHFGHGNIISRIGFNIYNRILRRNSKSGSRDNIKAHYDVGNDFYRLWLDESMTYSSALFEHDNMSLREAQAAKYRRILSKLDGMRNLLEIGCGWGGFAEEAAKDGRQLTGITISPSQYAYAKERLADKADIRQMDYRDTPGTFDAVVSIEMFEAVGEAYWPEYFSAVKNHLKPNGKAIIQTITMRDSEFEEYRLRSDFIRHYVFPGGMLPSVGRFREEAAKVGLQCKEVFAFGQDYAHTLRQWLNRFEARLPEIRAMGYSEAFIRNWRFYLSMCAAAFAAGRTNVVQVELAHA